jgi:hypothetical protein
MSTFPSPLLRITSYFIALLALLCQEDLVMPSAKPEGMEYSPRGSEVDSGGIPTAALLAPEKIEFVGGIFASERERLS